MSKTILTTDNGTPIGRRPKRVDFVSDVEFIRAVHAFNDRVTAVANAAFDASFRRAMRGGK